MVLFQVTENQSATVNELATVDSNTSSTSTDASIIYPSPEALEHSTTKYTFLRPPRVNTQGKSRP